MARELGVHDGTLGNWVNADRRRRERGGGRLSEDERAELVRLRKHCAELQMRCDVLKRSVALWVGEAMGRLAVAAFIAAQRDDHGVPHATACQALGVSQSWLYKWKAGVVPPRARHRERLKAEISRLFQAHEGTYGAPRITADLRDEGWRVSENTVAALMRKQGLAARRRKQRRSTTRPGRGRWRSPDLVQRDFAAEGINQKWYGDGTEIPTGEGKLHLASVLDMGSRRIVGFGLSEHHDAELAYGAVAVRGGQVPDVIMHTDGGSEYTAGLFRNACGRLRIRQSMGRPGSALDNAVIEAWHSTLTFELRSRETFATQAAARARIPAWIDHYNRQRRHSSIGMISPVDDELAQPVNPQAGPA
ncbi:MAG: IS3 family transposase [Pseudonocardiaceae bacterium]